MRHVILRDDDTNALTPVACLEKLYRPFLACGLPVNLAVIPDVRTDATRPDGRPEEFLFGKNGEGSASSFLSAGGSENGRHGATRPAAFAIGQNRELVRYLRDHPGYHIAQHGYDHSLFEFDSRNAAHIRDRLEHGSRLLTEAGLRRPQTFVAPYDRFSAVSLREAARRFRVVSTGWFEWKRLPSAWWPRFFWRKLARHPHCRIGKTRLLTHPGCLLSRERPRATMLETVKQAVAVRRLTVLVTHWWEYFPEGRPDEPFIGILHQTAAWLAAQPDVQVISFDHLAESGAALL